MRNISVKALLKAVTFIPTISVAVVFLLFYNIELIHERQTQVRHLADAYTRQLLPVAQLALIKNDTATLKTLIDASIINREVDSLAFFDDKGRLLAYRGEKPSPISKKEETIIKKDTENPYNIQMITPIRMTPFGLYTPPPFQRLEITQADDIIGWVSMSLDTTSLWAEQYKIGIVSSLIIGLGLLIAFLIHHVLSRKIYHPIQSLEFAMTQISNNQFEIPLHQTSCNEIGAIEKGCIHLQKHYLEALAETQQNIENAIKELQESHELLEEKNIQLLLDKRVSEEKHQQKSAFIANLSHEIRTPINGIIGFTELLIESPLKPLEHDYVKTIRSSAQTLINTLNDILDYSKIDAKKLQLDSIPLDIRACIDEVFALSAPKAHKKGLDFIPSTAADVPKTVLGDPNRLKQIIRNLVDNAIKFTDAGYIVVRTKIEEENESSYKVCLSVTDTGIGISPQEQTHLFNPFQQAGANIFRRYGGSGLGLVICKQLAEQMQGRLSLVSEPNKGSTFSAHLTFDKFSVYEIEKNRTHPYAHLSVLCYDENSLYLEAIQHGLECFHIKPTTVETYAKLEEIWQSDSHFDIAFLNVSSEQKAPIKKLIQKKKTSVVLLSKQFISDYAQQGAVGFLFKPPNIQKLQDMIESILNPDDFSKANHSERAHDATITELRKKLLAQKCQLLIADDNSVNRMLYYSWLHDLSSLTLVGDGQESVRLCQHQKFDAIVLDLHMPNLNGIEATQKIRETAPLNESTPIFLISATSEDMAYFDLKKNGIDFRLEKPLDEKTFLDQLIFAVSLKEEPLIDWPLSIQKMSGNESLTRELMAAFIDELHQDKRILLHAIHFKDFVQLEEIAHKIHSACCFLGLPLLQKQIKILESCAKQAIYSETLLQAFHACITQIDRLIAQKNKNILTR